jgi:serine phosphatase RsbU (regulator of sigma subunit)
VSAAKGARSLERLYMTIRQRLTLSFIALLALFGVSLGVYSWSAQLRGATMKRLDRTLQRRMLLATMRQDVDNLQKQVALLSQSELALDAAPDPIRNHPDERSHQSFDEKAQGVARQIASLKSLSEPEDAASVTELETTYANLEAAWKAFYDYLGTEQAWAVASAAKADPVSFRLQTEILPRLQEQENQRVEAAETSFARVETLTHRVSTTTFIFSLLFASGVAWWLSRSIGRGFLELQHGTDLIGNMDLKYRIPIKSNDELGRFARSFNSMTERLEHARKQLTETNEELARRNEEIKQRQAKELKLAAEIQQGLMAVRIPDLSFASIRARNISCTEIGGDFYDVIVLETGEVAVIICDVSGKGISAAIMASMLQGMIRSELASNAKVPLKTVVEELNCYFTQRDVAGKYATLCICRLDPCGTLDYINCGHVPPLLVSSTGVKRLESNNPPVALLPMMEYESNRLHLNAGDRLVLVTDGVTEAAAAEEEFGDARLENAAHCEDPFESVFAAVSRFCGETAFNDDCTVVEVAYAGEVGSLSLEPLSKVLRRAAT